MKVITLGNFSGKDKVQADIKELDGLNAAGLDETVHLTSTSSRSGTFKKPGKRKQLFDGEEKGAGLGLTLINKKLTQAQ